MRQAGPALRSVARGLATFMVAGLLAATVAPASTVAQGGTGPAPQPSIGVIDMQHVLTESAAARRVVAQRDGFLNKYKARTAEVEKELRETDQELGRLRSTLPPEAFNTRYQEFQTRVSEFQAEVQTRRRNLERAFGEAMNEIQSAVIRAADTVASKRGMNLLLYRNQVFLFDPSMDLTDEVLALVNEKLPNVTMADPDTLSPLDDDTDDAGLFGRQR